MSSPIYTEVDISRRIRALLALRGETQTSLAKRLGVTQSALAYPMTGRRPYGGRCSLDRIATALEVPVTSIIQGKPWPDVTNEAGPGPRYTDVDISKRIRALLALRGETQTSLAQRLGVTQSALAYPMTGRRPYGGRCSLERIALALEVPPTTIVQGTPWPIVSEDGT
jgi:transcriptional regulator with XRE-family HTH domain